MYYAYGHNAEETGSGPNIHVTNSQPLGARAFVPVEVSSMPDTNNATSSHAKQMRVPRGGSVERNTKPHTQTVKPSAINAPSVHVTLETSDNTRHAPTSFSEEHPDSLAEFVSTYPKIPSDMIFQFGEEDYRNHTRDKIRARELDDAVPLGTRTAPYSHTQHSGQQTRASFLNNGRLEGQTNAIPAVNPRFEKLVREASGGRSPYTSPVMQSANPHGMRTNMGGRQGRVPAVSGPVGGTPNSYAPVPPMSPAPNTLRANPFQQSRSKQRNFSRGIKSTPAPAPSSAASLMSSSTPLVDSAAIEESTIFDQPPIPIEEGMKTADKKHKKGRKLIFAFVFLLAIAGIGTGAVTYLNNQDGSINIPVPVINITTTDINGNTSDSSNSQSGNTSSEDGKAASVQGMGAGAVVYRYTAKTPTGVEYTVEESTNFDEAGNCTLTNMKMKFPTEAAAKEFTDTLARDLGAKYTLDSINGPNAVVTIDNSALMLNREKYENALRYSVDDLVIVKK